MKNVLNVLLALIVAALSCAAMQQQRAHLHPFVPRFDHLSVSPRYLSNANNLHSSPLTDTLSSIKLPKNVDFASNRDLVVKYIRQYNEHSKSGGKSRDLAMARSALKSVGLESLIPNILRIAPSHYVEPVGNRIAGFFAADMLYGQALDTKKHAQTPKPHFSTANYRDALTPEHFQDSDEFPNLLSVLDILYLKSIPIDFDSFGTVRPVELLFYRALEFGYAHEYTVREIVRLVGLLAFYVFHGRLLPDGTYPTLSSDVLDILSDLERLAKISNLSGADGARMVTLLLHVNDGLSAPDDSLSSASEKFYRALGSTAVNKDRLWKYYEDFYAKSLRGKNDPIGLQKSDYFRLMEIFRDVNGRAELLEVHAESLGIYLSLFRSLSAVLRNQISSWRASGDQ